MILKVIVIVSCVFHFIASVKVPIQKIEPQSISPRIVGGRDAAVGQAPFQCSLQRKSSGHYCGCAILSSVWIVTAGHCLNKRSPIDIEILVGTNDRCDKLGKYYNAEKFIIHKDYGNPTYAYDIGLIRVQTPIEFNERVQPIKTSSNEVKSGFIMQVFGWGRMGKNREMPKKLQVLNVTSISNEECQKKQANVVHDSHLCTQAPAGQGICSVNSASKGDSGSTLIFGTELVGVVNWAFSCGRGSPIGFARISYLYEWIKKSINSP